MTEKHIPQKLVWVKESVAGENRFEGNADKYGNYSVERDISCAKTWNIHSGGVDIGTADNVVSAKHIAQSHCDGLPKIYAADLSNDDETPSP